MIETVLKRGLVSSPRRSSGRRVTDLHDELIKCVMDVPMSMPMMINQSSVCTFSLSPCLQLVRCTDSRTQFGRCERARMHIVNKINEQNGNQLMSWSDEMTLYDANLHKCMRMKVEANEKRKAAELMRTNDTLNFSCTHSPSGAKSHKHTLLWFSPRQNGHLCFCIALRCHAWPAFV